MDLTLARKSGQELHNNYTIINSPALAQLRKFFHAAVRDLTSAYENRAAARVEVDPQPSISRCSFTQDAIRVSWDASCGHGCYSCKNDKMDSASDGAPDKTEESKRLGHKRKYV